MEGLTKLEKAVLEMLVDGKAETFQLLRKQYLATHVTERHLTGVGFWTNFSIPAGTVKLSGSPSFWFGDVLAKIDGLKHGAGFELLVKEAIFVCLKAIRMTSLGLKIFIIFICIMEADHKETKKRPSSPLLRPSPVVMSE
jgi:hypothetical protein